MNYYHPYNTGVASRNWQDGEIAFLKSHETFLNKDHRDLVASGYLPRGATNHPVIILQAGPDRAIVTTVSAYNSGADTNFLPPWRMFAHRDKHYDDFHAFVGTKLPPRSTHDHLRLCNPGAKMNKPQASWVYIKSFFTVPYSVLIPWNRVPQQLRVSKESLMQLRADIQRKYRVQLQDAKSRLTMCSRDAESILDHSNSRNCQMAQEPEVYGSPLRHANSTRCRSLPNSPLRRSRRP